MISYKQIKAARCLLDWRQVDLATKTGLALPTINAIERNIGSPRQSTLMTIKTIFEKEGIEFKGQTGVDLIEKSFEILQFEGDDFIQKQNDDLFACMKDERDEVYMCGLDESLFEKYAPDQIMRYERHQQETQFIEKILIRDDDTYLLANTDVYRTISKTMIGKIPYLVYKNRFVMIDWQAKRTIIIQNQAIADNFKKQFLYLWEMATPISRFTKRKLDDPKFIQALENKSNADD